jgi:hypothetical protein
MPDALEYVVRPYTAPDAHGRIIIPSTPTRREHATLTWGATGTMPQPTGINFQVVCCKDALDEMERQSDDVDIPIQDAGDGTSHVTVSRPNSMTLSKKETNTCGDNWDQFSGVGQEVNSIISDFQSLMDETTGTSAKNCGETWKFHNQ